MLEVTAGVCVSEGIAMKMSVDELLVPQARGRSLLWLLGSRLVAFGLVLAGLAQVSGEIAGRLWSDPTAHRDCAEIRATSAHLPNKSALVRSFIRHCATLTEEQRDSLALLADNPRNSRAWIAIGLSLEQTGGLKLAAQALDQAERINRQYLPAWTRTNFAFRHGDRAQFWASAYHAAAMIYDDPAPLLILADRAADGDPARTLEGLGDTAQLRRAYLDLLVGQKRWQEAEVVAGRLLEVNGSSPAGGPATEWDHDRRRVIVLATRLIRSGMAEQAFSVWRKVHDRHVGTTPAAVAPDHLYNGEFLSEPTGEAFDWSVRRNVGIESSWRLGEVKFAFFDGSPEQAILLSQVVLTSARKQCLGFQIIGGANGLGVSAISGFHWVLSSGTRVEGDMRLPQEISLANRIERPCFTTRAGLATLTFRYQRPPGTKQFTGQISLRRVFWKSS